jgi:23S rRNA (adenine2503-C2)-methyltransferase
MTAEAQEFVPSAVTAKVNLLGLSRQRLRDLLVELGEKPFRADQLMKWMHHYGVSDFEEMSNLGKALRARLADIAEIRAPEVAEEHISADGTRKWAFRVGGNSLVETVFIPDGKRGTLCVSSQVGCSLDCSFCSTGKQGFQRDLSSDEIVGQIWLAANSLGRNEENRGDRGPITNVVFMGMGEPLLNFDNVMQAISVMMEDHGYGISKRRVTLSTSGVVPAMDRMIGVVDASLAISLHAPNDELRNQLVPINRKYPISELLAATARYMGSLPGSRRVVTIEYALMQEVNDLDEHAHQLVEVLRNTPCKINLIPFNPFPNSGYQRPTKARVERFQKILFDAGYIVTTRTTRGDDIDAACGQLAGKVKDKTRRSERHQAKVQTLKIQDSMSING